jgi:DNA-binding MarR family transcriptional regulator
MRRPRAWIYNRGVQKTTDTRRSRAAAEIGRDCLAMRVRLLGRAITRVYDSALRPHGVNIAQVNLLVSIGNFQPVPSGKLADALSMDISTLSRNVALMEREGWVDVLKADRGNGRVLRLTEVGAAKLDALKPAWSAAQKEAAALLGPDATRSIMEVVDDALAEGIDHL